MAAKVLLVEDDNNLREIYEARLQAEGYVIVTAKDGEEALVVAKAERPDLIISDVMMPRISGFEMLDILRNTEDLRDTKVIMLTALGQADDKTRADSLGADRYLVKSQVTLEDIVKAAHELVEGQPGMMPPSMTTAAVPTPPPVAQATPPATPTPGVPASGPSPAFAAPQSVASTPPAAAPMPAAPVQPAPVSSPVVPPMQAPTPPAPAASTPATMPVPPAPTATDLPAASTADEKATVSQQISNFVDTADVTAPPAEPSPATQDDAVLANAVTDLTANAAQATPPVTTPPSPVVAPTQPEPTPEPVKTVETDPANNSVTIANKKIIQPLNTTPKPDLNQLLAQDAAKDILMKGYDAKTAVTAPNPVSPPAPSTDMPPAPAHPAGSVFTPSAAATTPPAPQNTEQGPSKASSELDPNNIAL